MKHVTYAEKSMLIGDEAADLLIEYAAAIVRAHTADTVDLNAIGSDGNAVRATFLLGEGAPLMAETASADIEEPDNSLPIVYMRDHLRLLESPPVVMAIEPGDPEDFEADDDFATQGGN
jgi:hypothetical protein